LLSSFWSGIDLKEISDASDLTPLIRELGVIEILNDCRSSFRQVRRSEEVQQHQRQILIRKSSSGFHRLGVVGFNSRDTNYYFSTVMIKIR